MMIIYCHCRLLGVRYGGAEEEEVDHQWRIALDWVLLCGSAKWKWPKYYYSVIQHHHRITTTRYSFGKVMVQQSTNNSPHNQPASLLCPASEEVLE